MCARGEDQIIFTKQKIDTFKIDNMTQWMAAFHIGGIQLIEVCPLDGNYWCRRPPNRVANVRLPHL
jgi:hypothetical protein